ncbi:MAG: lipopolysaccharide exporter [Oleiphilaceae bacterium]|jgi:lipopolysaccharide exporter
MLDNSRILKSALILSLGRIMARILGLLSTFIVARLLAPEDYGVIAVCMIMQGLGTQLQNIGFSQNIISKKNPSKDFLDAVYLFRLLVSISFAFAIYALAGSFALYMNSVEVESVLAVTCWMLVFAALNNLNITLEAKNNNFVPEMIVLILSKLLTVIFTLGMAYYLRNYWALALGMLFQSMLQAVLSYLVIKPYRPEYLNFKMLVGVFHFGKWIVLQRMLDFGNAKAGDFIIARFFDSKMLGFYTLSSSVCFMIYQEVSAAVDRANFSFISEKVHQTVDKVSLGELMERNVSYIYHIKNLFLIPSYTVLFFYSNFFVEVLFGSQWTEMAGLFELFCVIGLVRGYNSTYISLFHSIRKPELNFYAMFIRLLLLIPFIFITINLSDVHYLLYGDIFAVLVVYAYYVILFRKVLLASAFQSTLILIVQVAKCSFIISLLSLLEFPVIGELAFVVATLIALILIEAKVFQIKPHLEILEKVVSPLVKFKKN